MSVKSEAKKIIDDALKSQKVNEKLCVEAMKNATSSKDKRELTIEKIRWYLGQQHKNAQTDMAAGALQRLRYDFEKYIV